MLNSDPLMFIETAATKGVSSGRVVYDSRYDKNVMLEEQVEPLEVLIIDEDTLLRLESIIDLYQMSKPVLCNVKTIDGNYECIPIEIENEYLYVKHKGDILSLELNKILEVIILRV